MAYLGAHVSVAGGLVNGIINGEALGCETIQIFGSSPRQWTVNQPTPESIKSFKEAWKKSQIKTVYLHAPYLINLASPEESSRVKSIQCLADHFKIAHDIGAQGIIFHIGSGKEMPKDEALTEVVKCMKEVLKKVPGTTQLIIENTAGGGQKVGATFEEIGEIIKRVGSERVKVCLDTQHTFAAGLIDDYSPEKLKQLVGNFDKYIGLDNLVAFHANDSKTIFDSHHDRHENIGEGHIGLKGFNALASEKKLDGRSWILEVPGFDDEGPDLKNMALLKKCFS